MAYDITNAVLDKLVAAYTLEMQTNISKSDLMRLKTIAKWPFQEDPTTHSPLIVVGPDIEKGRILDPFHTQDIGGGIRWMHFFVIRGHTPLQKTKEKAYESVGKLNSRAVAALVKAGLSATTTDDGTIVYGMTKANIDLNVMRIYGGDPEWYGEFKIEFHLLTEDTN